MTKKRDRPPQDYYRQMEILKEEIRNILKNPNIEPAIKNQKVYELVRI